MKRMVLVAWLGIWAAVCNAATLVSAEEAFRDKSPHLILDVRTAQEFAEGHLPGAINIPHDVVSGDDPRLKGWKDKPVLVYCRSGRRRLPPTTRPSPRRGVARSRSSSRRAGCVSS